MSHPEPPFDLEVLEAVKAPGVRGFTGPASTKDYEVPVDVRESATEYALFLDIPGVDEDDVRVAWDAETLVVSGVREFDHDQEDAEQFIRLERPYGPFLCRMKFEKPVISSSISAKYRRGVLKVRIPKSARLGTGGL